MLSKTTSYILQVVITTHEVPLYSSSWPALPHCILHGFYAFISRDESGRFVLHTFLTTVFFDAKRPRKTKRHLRRVHKLHTMHSPRIYVCVVHAMNTTININTTDTNLCQVLVDATNFFKHRSITGGYDRSAVHLFCIQQRALRSCNPVHLAKNCAIEHPRRPHLTRQDNQRVERTGCCCRIVAPRDRSHTVSAAAVAYWEKQLRRTESNSPADFFRLAHAVHCSLLWTRLFGFWHDGLSSCGAQ